LRLFIVTLCATAAVASLASAQPAASSADDAKCVLDMVALSNSSTPEAQRAGQEGVLFFVGRISAHEPSFDFARLKAMSQNMSAQAAQSELQQKCGPMFQRYMKQFATALSPPAPPASAPPAAH
jgi:hypothetical protein